MNSPERKRILLVEDEVHKREELTRYLEEFVVGDKKIDVVDSVREAITSLGNGEYDLIVLDMALPTFTVSDESSDGGLDQALGGVEVLRFLKSQNRKSIVIIVTQYPDISLDGKRVRLRAAQLALKKKYDQEIVGAVLYKYKSSGNRSKMRGILDSIW